MQESPRKDLWAAGDLYEPYVGPWSRVVAKEFLSWRGKRSDVNLALAIARGAYRNEYDQAFLVTGDSDIAPAVRMVQADFPEKKFKIITPPGRRHSKELGALADKLVRIKEFHLERSLFPEFVIDDARAS